MWQECYFLINPPEVQIRGTVFITAKMIWRAGSQKKS